MHGRVFVMNVWELKFHEFAANNKYLKKKKLFFKHHHVKYKKHAHIQRGRWARWASLLRKIAGDTINLIPIEDIEQLLFSLYSTTQYGI